MLRSAAVVRFGGTEGIPESKTPTQPTHHIHSDLRRKSVKTEERASTRSKKLHGKRDGPVLFERLAPTVPVSSSMSCADLSLYSSSVINSFNHVVSTPADITSRRHSRSGKPSSPAYITPSECAAVPTSVTSLKGTPEFSIEWLGLPLKGHLKK